MLLLLAPVRGRLLVIVRAVAGAWYAVLSATERTEKFMLSSIILGQELSPLWRKQGVKQSSTEHDASHFCTQGVTPYTAALTKRCVCLHRSKV